MSNQPNGDTHFAIPKWLTRAMVTTLALLLPTFWTATHQFLRMRWEVDRLVSQLSLMETTISRNSEKLTDHQTDPTLHHGALQRVADWVKRNEDRIARLEKKQDREGGVK